MSLAAIQQAAYEALSGALDCAVYDDVPAGASFPYVVIGDSTAVPFDTDDSEGIDSTLTVHVWSRYAGRKETKELQYAIKAALHLQSLPVPGLVALLFEESQDFNDADGLTRHGVSVFRFIVSN